MTRSPLIIRFFILLGLFLPTLASAVPPMVSAGMLHTVTLKSDGTVMAWGLNNGGQLGDGTTTDRYSPAAVPGLNGVVAVSAGWYHSVALKSDGTVVAWGSNYYGQLGDGTMTDRRSPVAVTGLTGVVAVDAGYLYTVALKSDGTVWAWGDNLGGKLGDGTTTQRNSPVAVQGLSGVGAVATLMYHTAAVKCDGTVMVWGSNEFGILGDGTRTDRHTPVAVPGLTGVVAVARTEGGPTVALKGDGTVVAWGSNTYGQLGDGTTTNRYSPAAVPGLTGVVAVTGTMALKSDGTVVAWGQNGYGSLGLGIQNGSYLSPVAVPGLTGVVAVAQGHSHTVALKSDGTVVEWGTIVLGRTFLGSPGTLLSSPVAMAGVSLGASTIVSPAGLNQCASTAAAISDTRVFAYAEANYPDIFTGTATAGQHQQYGYRYYPTSGNYLAVDTTRGIWLLGPYTDNTLSYIGPVSSFSSAITSWEATRLAR